jgi:motility quorum-sensing regulator/GCU-specific mRNA interferase toxin
MEKRTPHYKLTTIKALIRADKVAMTASASSGARAVGIRSLQGMCEVINSLRTADFYKSMTTHTNHRLWQDVYHGRTANGVALYIKLTVIDGVLIVSFKEL